jgi:hypothetical protein
MKRTFFERLADWWAGVPWSQPTAEEYADAAALVASVRTSPQPPSHILPSSASPASSNLNH